MRKSQNYLTELSPTKSEEDITNTQQFLEEMQVLEKAHKILMQKWEEEQKNNSDPNIKLQSVYSQFVNFTSVKQVIDEMAAPILQTVPKLKKEFELIQQSQNSLFLINKQRHADIQKVQKEQLKMNEQLSEITKMRTTLGFEQQKQENLKTQIEANQKSIKQQLEILNVKIDKMNSKIKEQDMKMIDNQNSLDNTQLDIQNQVKKQFSDIITSIEKVKVQQNKLWTDNEKTVKSCDNFNQQIQSSINELIRDIYQQNSTKTVQLSALENKLKDFKSQLDKFKSLTNNLDEIQYIKAISLSNQTFIMQSLPILMHFQICESFNKILGENMEQNIFNFENAKLHDFYDYLHGGKTDLKNVSMINKRIVTLLKYFRDQEKGVLEFNFIEEMDKRKTIDDMGRIHYQLIQSLNKKYDKYLAKKTLYQDALDQVMVQKDRFSPIIIGHRIQNLSISQLAQIRDSVLYKRLIDLKKYDDLMIEQLNAPIESPKSNNLKTNINKLLQNQFHSELIKKDSKQMESSMIIIRKDKMRIYRKLDKKFSDLYTRIQNKLGKVRDVDLESIYQFSKIAQTVLEEISIQKIKFDQLWAKFEEEQKQLQKSNSQGSMINQSQNSQNMISQKSNSIQQIDKFE